MPPPRRAPFGFAGLVACLSPLAAGCSSDEKDEWECIGPVVEVMKWRDEREAARLLRGEVVTPAELARLERERVEAAVLALTPRRAACELTWSVMMHVPADNPGLRLREEALLRVLELPPRDYPANAVGWAGVTTAGHTPMAQER
ncbi:MAG: hypothetical protein V4850_07120 [Myxococcota bacterium]